MVLPRLPKASIGGVRYVAKTGNDETNTGLSAESPFLTINHALIDLGEVGGTVYVAEGGYVETNGVDLAAMNIANEVALVGMTGRAEDVRVTTAKDGVTRHVLHLNHPRASARFMTFQGGRATSVSDGNSDSGMNVRILLLPDGDDPDSFARKHNASEFRDYVQQHQMDFLHFKTATMGHTMIMGRKTFDSMMRRKLPGRRTLVITGNQDYGMRYGVDTAESFEEACRIANIHDKLAVISVDNPD